MKVGMMLAVTTSMVVGSAFGYGQAGSPAPTATPAAAPAVEASSQALTLNAAAPDFKLKNQAGEEFSLESRRGKGWTVLYFYPKADSPGCTTQACAFRDTINRIKQRNALLVGISADSQEDQKAFHEKHKLNFNLLSDPELAVIERYGLKLPIVGMAKRWTFILDPNLVIRSIEPNVDPAFDAEWTAESLDELQNPPKAGSENDPD